MSHLKKGVIKIDLPTLIRALNGFIWMRVEIENVAMSVRLPLSVIFWLNNKMIVLQPALFIVVYIREVMEITDAVFLFLQAKCETDVQSSATNICSGRLHNDLELRTHKK
jgi:hypothetical protein